MRHVLALVIICGALSPAAARTLDLSKPEDVIRAEIKLGCALDPAKPRLSWMTGTVYSQRAGEANRHLFDVAGVNTRACTVVDDPKRGPGYRSVTREIMFYLDPATGKILDTWANPWTGETVDVIHMFNDPVNMAQPKYAYDADGKPTAKWSGTIINGQAIERRINPNFRDSPMGGDYQDYVGGKYAVMEMSTTIIPAAEWLDTTKPGPVRVASVWTRTSQWLPWMKMGGRDGTTILTSLWVTGVIDDVPEPARSAIKQRYPAYATAPPLDDQRPSVFSWLGMKQAIDRKRVSAPR